MRKISALALVVFLTVAFLSSCRAPHKCEAYSQAKVKAPKGNS
jgi:hypothetical protein